MGGFRDVFRMLWHWMDSGVAVPSAQPTHGTGRFPIQPRYPSREAIRAAIEYDLKLQAETERANREAEEDELADLVAMGVFE
jgi:hypothetical protein